MRIVKYILTLLSLSIFFILSGCVKYPLIQEPDVQKFNQIVYSPALRDSLLKGKLTEGMPYFIVNQLFKDWTAGIKETKIPVASLGSKQRLEESEGWNRKFVDPNTKFFLDIYETPKGKLYVWYQRPDFYAMDISGRDTLCIFQTDTVFCSVINYLNKSSVLTIKDSLPQLPTYKSFYAEVHYNDHPWRKVSYWFNIKILSNAKTFKIGVINYELYPVEVLEFNNEPVSSFNWKEIIQNED
ncbi:MAG: hypothetical protein P8Z35_19045 [Ignavibacteriaceae bacterium]|jgi:hypothetical protein